jgi:hypothetical protein
MKLTLWQQFSSNHSSSFTVVGEFPTPEAAQNALSEIHRILQKIADWHRAHPGEFDDARTDGNSMAHPTPPELELAQQYGIEWRSAIAWFDKVSIDIHFDRYVFLTRGFGTDSVGEPFDQVMDKLGGKGYLEGNSVGNVLYGILFTLTCDAPDEATAQAFIDGNLGFHWLIRRTGTHLIFDRCRFGEYPAFINLVAELREKSCQNIQFSFSQWDREQPLYTAGDFDRIVEVLEKGTDSDDRRLAADWLEMLGDKRAVEPLLNALDDDDNHVQRAVIHALKSLGDERAVQPLVRLLDGVTHLWVRITIMKALGGFDTALAVEGLIKGLQDDNPYVWKNAADELGKKGASVRNAVQKLVEIPGMEERVAHTLRLIDAAQG